MHKETHYYVFYELFCTNNHIEIKYAHIAGKPLGVRGAQETFGPKMPPKSLEMALPRSIYRILIEEALAIV